MAHAETTTAATPERRPDETIELAVGGVTAEFQRFGCSECGRGVKRVVMRVMPDKADVQHHEFVGPAAEMIWNMADQLDIEVNKWARRMRL